MTELISYLRHGLPSVSYEKVLWTIITVLITAAVNIGKETLDSINKLNIQMGVVIERLANYDTRIERLENARIKR